MARQLIFITCALLLISCTAPKTPLAVLTTEAVPLTSSVPETTPTLAPTLESNPNGTLIYDDGKDILAVNADTGETQKLISREELQLLIGQDKSADSYTYQKERSIPITLSPDLKYALVSICIALDARLRCAEENFIYSLENKNVIRLPNPPDSYGVYWKWSPDGSKLAGASWNYLEAAYQLGRFYVIDKDAQNLNSLTTVNNGNWQIAWNPNGRAIHLMTFVTNFQLLFVDGSGAIDISIPSLAWNDKVECLSFSPNNSQVAFVLRKELPKDHDWVYTADSDFSNSSLISDYDLDSSFFCSIQWSPDAQSLHIQYKQDERAEAGAKIDPTISAPDKLIDITSKTIKDSPANTQICGWTPNGNLVISQNDLTGQDVGIEVQGASTPLPESISAIIKHCPFLWLSRAPELVIPEGLSVGNACHPGVEIQDPTESEPLPELFDILSVSSSLNGEEISVTFHSAAASKDLNDFLSPGISEKYLNGWEVLIDADNNALSGDKLGFEYRFSAAVKPRPNGNPPGLAGAVIKFDSSANSYSALDNLEMLYDPDASTLTLTGSVPGLSQSSRLVFLSRLVNNITSSGPITSGDRLCD